MTRPSITQFRKMLASAKDEEVACWYLGVTYVCIDGAPDIPVLQAETVMIYRPQTIDDTHCVIHWWEIGYFRDPITGDIAESWINPVTGRVVEAPRRFEEGPGRYSLTQGDDGVGVELDQPFATIRSVTPTLSVSGGRARFSQEEIKERGFPLANGTMAPSGSPDNALARTVLTLYANEADLGPGGPSTPAAKGTYVFSLGSLSPWMGFDETSTGRIEVRGTMIKAATDAQLNPQAWSRLKSLFPQYFDGDRLIPPWAHG